MDMTTIFQISLLLGRIITGGYFIMGGVNHLTKMNMMAPYAQSKGLPAAKAGVAGTGVMLLLGGLSLLLGYHPTIGALLLVVFLLAASFTMHNFWTVKDPQQKMGEMVHFGKNIALLGLVLMTLGIPRPWPMSVGH